MRGAACLLALSCAALPASCIRRPTTNPNVVVLTLANGPNNLDPRIGTDDSSQKLHELIFDNLVSLDEQLRPVPRLAERIDHPDPLTYVAHLRRGVRFHDGRLLTADDVVYTFKFMLDPAFVSGKKGGFRELASVAARDPHTVVFKLTSPFESFPINLNVMPIVPAAAGPELRDRPIGTGPYRFVRYDVDDKLELEAFAGYYGGAPKNAGLIFKIVPDEVMRGLELRKGTIDLVVNDVSPDIVHQLEDDPRLQTVTAPGVDYQYIGLNLRDRALRDVKVRQALAYAIDREAIVQHLRRGLATTAPGFLPRLSWAVAEDIRPFPHDLVKARQLLDAAGFTDPDGDGPAQRLTLTLKTSTTEFYRLQASVIQQQLRQAGVGIEVRSYEFATLYADVLAGNFQMYSLQWTAAALADPDILRRVFHSSQVPPDGFNRGGFSDPQVDSLLDAAAASTDRARRLELYQEVQRELAVKVPYISLWHKINVAVGQRTLTGVHLTPLADLMFLRDVTRVPARAAN
jgi:peptide/nickel transport system substrate-binding protein